jgi:alanine racemase
MAVVKADAYGLGSEAVTLALAEQGCENFAVTTVAEGLALRELGITGDILLLGPTLPPEWPAALAANLILSVSGLEMLEQLAGMAGHSPVRLHLEVETGMGRTGLLPEQAAAAWGLLSQAPGLRAEGIYTHFARAAERDRAYTALQYRRYTEFVDAYRAAGGSDFVRHVCNSAAFLDYPEYHLDFVRLGTLLSGHYPAPDFRSKLPLSDPWQGKARILHIREADAGVSVGYGSAYRTRQKTRLAVIAAGYSHGFGASPLLRPQGLVDLAKIIVKNCAMLCGVELGGERVTYKGTQVRTAGRIGMQLSVIEIGSLPCQVGEEVDVPLRRTLTNFTVERCYTKNKQIVQKRTTMAGFQDICPENI